MDASKVNYTKVWKVNGILVIAENPEDAIDLYRRERRHYCTCCPNIDSVELVYGDEHCSQAILSVDKDIEEELV